jgi:DNA-binding NtrC family response regulator
LGKVGLRTTGASLRQATLFLIKLSERLDPWTEMKKILVVDDEAGIRETLKALLKSDYTVVLASNGEEGIRHFQESAPDLILLDVAMPKMDGMTALKKLRAINPDVPIIMLTATLTAKTAVEAMKIGADDYLTKPFDLEELKLVIAKELATRALHKEVLQLRTDVSKRYGLENIIGNSRPIEDLFSKIRHLADTKTTILLMGESGTGKELVARALHFNSLRKHRPFIAINCAAIPETLLESELFGHERGAFTDAQSRRIGRFEQAHQGTLFLDEVADLSLSCQAKILRALQEKKFMRVGGTELIESDVRLIAATNKVLEEEIKQGRFREDLYYRINVVPISLPPLRQRKEDIPLLIKHFLNKKAKEEALIPKTITPKAMELLIQYDWPGNIREMENIIEQMATLSSGNVIDTDDIPITVLKKVKQNSGEWGDMPDHLSLNEAVQTLERKMISQALKRTGHIQTRAAKLLGISRRILKYKMDGLRLDDPEKR